MPNLVLQSQEGAGADRAASRRRGKPGAGASGSGGNGAPGNSAAGADSDNRVAYTLQACCRCRSRKTRCDPGLPRCEPCERTNSHCEYYDPVREIKVPRDYVVYIQKQVQLLEQTYDQLITRQPATSVSDSGEVYSEDIIKGPAAIAVGRGDEGRYLGPASGIAISRLVIQLAKQFSDAQSVSDIVDEQCRADVRTKFASEQAKPTSKVYPLTNTSPAESLPPRELVTKMVEVFYMRIQPIIPIFHEPTFNQHVDDVFAGDEDPYKHYCVRMVIAISLQKSDPINYAGLADSHYLAALDYFPACLKMMDMRTLQCFALISYYSIQTPTRTGVYFVLGIATRLLQALGMTEEKTIVEPVGKPPRTALEADMCRKMFWTIVNLEVFMSLALGRPTSLPVDHRYTDVKFPELVDDKDITDQGIVPGAPKSRRKLISTHFHRMFLIQIEIRRTLYAGKKKEPKDDCHRWFRDVEDRMSQWLEESPAEEPGSSLGQGWFVGRCNFTTIFLFRPSPQIPRPSVLAAHKCFEASRYNIYLQRQMMQDKYGEVTWVFAQSLFTCIDTILWTLSYAQIRIAHPRAEVQGHLEVGLEALGIASSLWPGVASALRLYEALSQACMKIYDKNLGDVSIPVYSQPTPVAGGAASSSPNEGAGAAGASAAGAAAMDLGNGRATASLAPDYVQAFSMLNQRAQEALGGAAGAEEVGLAYLHGIGEGAEGGGDGAS